MRKLRRCLRTCGLGSRESPCSSKKKAWSTSGDRTSYRGPAVGNADERQERDFTALYVATQSQRVIILRIFVKKTEKTPRHEIHLALSRTKLIKPEEKK